MHMGSPETLIDNRFTNSKPIPLLEVFAVPQGRVESGAECERIVSSPVRELPDKFVAELSQFTHCFLQFSKEFNTMKFTLILVSEEIGITMHKHNAAMFMLFLGEKKWYTTSSRNLEGDSEVHPRLHWEKSLHKCILRQGEILFMPHEWYHEIFNLGEYTAGIQALLE